MRDQAFSLTCGALANPALTSIAWTRSGVALPDSSFVLEQPDGITGDTEYRCTVTNPQGEGTNAITVAAHCKSCGVL